MIDVLYLLCIASLGQTDTQSKFTIGIAEVPKNPFFADIQKNYKEAVVNSSKIGYSSGNGFGFSFETSSGDKITLDMSSKKALEYKKNDNGEALSFASEDAYKFRFETNGLSEADKAEIADAIEKIKPQLDDFLKKSGSEDFFRVPLDAVSAAISSELPKPKDKNTKNALSSSVVDMFEEALKNSEKPKSVFDDMKKILDKILKNIQNTQNIFYA